jgi:crossover junction endodeoxyribonuclease RuvC
MIYIGIDPGITGAIGLIWPCHIEVFDLPIMANGKGKAKVKNQINPSELANILTQAKNYYGADKIKVYLERVSSMPGQGVASMFSMGDTFGCIRGVCAALDLSVEIITPQSWKKYYNLGKDKEIVRAKAIELFPDAPLGRKKDHNRAEALLIAKYGMDK